MADELNKSYKTYESKGEIYDIPNDRVEYFLSKRKDAKLVNPDLADIEGIKTPAKDAAPSGDATPASDIRIPLLPGQTELPRTKREEDINVNITKPSPVGLGQNDRKDAPMFSLDGRKGTVTGEAPKIGVGGDRSFQDSWTNLDYSKMAPQTMISQQARKLGDELATLDREISEVAGEAHGNMRRNVENMSWMERIRRYGNGYQPPMNRDESAYLQQIGVSPEKQAEIRKIRDAQKLYNDAMTIFLNPSKGEQRFTDMPEAAAKRYISNADNMRTVGVSDIFKTADVLNISEKLEAANAFDSPEKVLTSGERALWDAFALKLAAETVRHDDTSWWTKAGELTADQATFIMQLMLGSGLTKKAADAATKSVKKFLVASIGNKIARKAAANVAGVGINAVRAAAWQPLNPAVYSRMNERMTGVDAGEDLDISPNGVHITGASNREGALEAYGGAVADMGLEVFTEMGGVGSAAFKALAHIPGVRPLLRMVGKTKVGQLYNTLGNSVGGKLANNFAYHGLGGETFEEFEMAVYDRLRSNPNAFDEFFDPNNLVPMLISFGAMSLGTTSVSMADWGISKAGYSAAEKRLNGRLSRYGLNEEEKNEIKESILATDVDDLKKTAGVIIGAFATDEKGNTAGDIAADVLSWLNNRIRYESYNEGLAKRHGALKYDYLFNKYTEPELDELGTVLDGITHDVDSQVNTSTGTLMTVTLGTGANATQVQVVKGIVSNEDGTVNKELSEKEFYYKDENGEVQVAPIDMAGTVVENVSRDDAVNQLTTSVLNAAEAQKANESASAVQDFKEGDLIYDVRPGVDVAIDVRLQGISDNGMYVGTDASGAQTEVEPRFAMSEQEYFDSMSNEEIKTSIDQINRSLSSTIQSGNLSNRTLDLRSKLESELQRRAQGVQVETQVMPETGGTPGTETQANGQKNPETDPVADITTRAPKQKNGKVDYDVLLEQSPEDFAVLYESEEGAEEARQELQSLSDNVAKKIEAERKRLQSADTVNKKKAAKEAIAELTVRKNRIDDIIRSRYEAQEATPQRQRGENPDADVVDDINRAFGGMVDAVEADSVNAVIQRLEKEGSFTMRNPEAVNAAKSNPRYNYIENGDGSIGVVGIRGMDDKWHGRAPEGVQTEQAQEVTEQTQEEVQPERPEVGPEETQQTAAADKVILGSPNEITDEDFINPSRDIQLPSLPDNTLKIINSEARPVVIKKEVFEKNSETHLELSPQDSRDILTNALYNPDLVGQSQPQKRNHYWLTIKTGEKNATVVIDVYPKKDAIEIVGWRYINEKGIDKLKRQAEREGGQILILSSNNGAAAALSALPSDLSQGKDNANISNNNSRTQENAGGGIISQRQEEAQSETSQAQTELPGDFGGDILSLASRVAKNAEIAEAERRTDSNPSEAQKEAGNYRMGHVEIQGFNISIEQPKGSVRSGVDRNGKSWSVTMNNTYGYIRGTEGRDHDQIDVFIGDNPSSGKVFVVDQMNPETGVFDEHKVMMGFDNIEQAREAYLSNYEEGWQGLGGITESAVEDFRKWAEMDGRRIKAFAEYKGTLGTSGTLGTVGEDSESIPLNGKETILFYDGQVITGDIVSRRNGKITIERNGIKYTVSESDIVPADISINDIINQFDRRKKKGIKKNEGEDNRFQTEGDLEAVNGRFNEELQRQIDGTLPKGHTYKIGNPSDVLQSAGIPNLPIELQASRLIDKSMQEEHPFELPEARNLPNAIQNPLAVFDSATRDGSFVILTEIEHNDKNFVVAIQANRKKGSIEINDIRSIHYRKSNVHIANWINNNLTRRVDKQKMSEWFSKQQYNSAEAKGTFTRATKIVQNFENPTIPGEKLQSPDEKMQSVPERAWRRLIDRLRRTGLARDVIADEGRMREYLEKHLGKERAERLMTWYHGSINDFDKFKRINAFTRSYDGIYFSNNKDIPEDYGNILYEVELPELSDEQMPFNEKDRKGIEAYLDFSSKMRANHSDINFDANVGEVILQLENKLGGVEAAHNWLMRAGVNGYTRESEADGRIAIMFNDKAIGIKSKTVMRLMATPRGEVYGFVTPEGDVYLDPNRMNANTPIHEFGHLWNSFIKENNPELWEKGKELIKNSPYWDKVNSNPAYSAPSEDEKADEVLAMAIGDRGEAMVHRGDVLGIARLRTWLGDLWRWIGEHLGIRGLDAGQVENLTLEDFVSGAVADLLSGEEIASSQRREDDNDTHFQFTGESEGDSRDVRDGGFPADDAPGGVEVAPPAIRPGEGLLEYAGRVSAWWNGNGRDMDGLTRELNEAKAKVFGLRRERDRIARSLKGIRETSAGKTEKLNRIKEAARELEEYIAENINSEIVDWMGVGEFRGLMARLRNPTSGKDVDAAIMAIDKTVNNIEVRRYGATLEALLKTKVLDRNQRGVSVAKNVDDDTRRSVEYLRSNRNLSEEEIDERVRAVNERMETGDVSDDVRRELSDLETVRRLAFINRVKNNIHAIDEDIRRAKEAWTDATVQSLNRERLGYQRDLIDAYDLAVREVSGLINTGRSRLADIVRKDIERRRKIAREAIEAVKYKPVLSQAEEKEKEKNRKLWDRIKDFTQENGVKEFFLAPQGNFDFMLKYIDYNHPMGEGRLYKRFMKSDEGVFAANDNFYRGLKEFRGAVRDKAEEIFGLDFGDVLADSRRHSGMSLEYMDRKENVNVIRMTYGELLYVYSVSKMTDGHAKLERMGIDDEAIERIRETLGEKYVRFSDWVQGEFLPGRRKV